MSEDGQECCRDEFACTSFGNVSSAELISYGSEIGSFEDIEDRNSVPPVVSRKKPTQKRLWTVTLPFHVRKYFRKSASNE